MKLITFFFLGLRVSCFEAGCISESLLLPKKVSPKVDLEPSFLTFVRFVEYMVHRLYSLR